MIEQVWCGMVLTMEVVLTMVMVITVYVALR